MSKVDIVWTSQAENDLRAVRAYIAADSPERAVVFVRRLKTAVEPLRKFPELGQVVPELEDPTIREIRVGYYRIIYRVRTSRVDVLTVHHGARLFPP
ncbi:MAG: type II toxin-antitoxin system RelE/ParE family toxin [Planctomycetes bacterium]|nr:type II toxin-antitoxin system RelE/ParE family toxin [Planctomycetota bacterium]